MATIKVEITYDPKKESLDQALASLHTAMPDTKEPATLPGQMAFNDRPADEVVSAKATTGAKAPDRNWEPGGGAAVEEPAKADAPAKQDKPAKAPSKTDIRAMATAVSNKDKAKLKSIFSEFGVVKLSDIPEEKYAELMEKLVAANA